MPQSLRSWVGRLGSAGLLLLPLLGRAQCPAAAACTPGSASAAAATLAAFRMGIYNVTLGTLNNTTAGYADGYQDYSCTLGATLTVSTGTAITVRNGTVANENVRVWIDYNNDGTFASNELAFASDNKLVHTGTITPPATATLGTRLRMRVASDYANNTTAITACSTPVYSQDEDYAVTLVANASPPTAALAASATFTCTGCVQFTDQSAGTPTSWSWDFGDNTTSTQQNPQHCYATAGTYQVKLTATNAAGSSTSAATAVTYNSSVPVAASCPGLGATANCCGYGITQVRLGIIANASADGSAGYQDFTCAQRTTLTAGTAYTLSVSTGGTQPYDTRAWLDANNDGVFASSEQVVQVLNAANPSASFTVPATAILGQPLRLRIVADGVGNNPQPCTAPQLGQVEDYTVTVQPNTNPPVAAFTSTYVAGACAATNTYTFTDQSTSSPTAWRWTVSPATGASFVGGTSATSPNPQIAFAAAGYYTVSLQATNAYGSSTVTKANYVLVQVPCPTYCAAAGGYSATINSATFYITNVSVTAAAGGASFGNLSASGAGGYTFYGSTPVVLLAGGNTQVLSVATSTTQAHRTSIWIDYNRDGTFANTTGNTELVYNGVVNAGVASTTLAVPSTLGITRMRVLVAADNNQPNPCALYYGLGEVEDYVVMPQALASAQSAALPTLTLSPNPTPDGEVRLSLADASANGRYALTVENVVGARLLSQELRLSAGTPATLSLGALPAGLYLVRLTNEQGQTALRRVVRQ